MSSPNVYRFVPRRQLEAPRPDWRQPRLSVRASLGLLLVACVSVWAALIGLIAVLAGLR